MQRYTDLFLRQQNYDDHFFSQTDKTVLERKSRALLALLLHFYFQWSFSQTLTAKYLLTESERRFCEYCKIVKDAFPEQSRLIACNEFDIQL